MIESLTLKNFQSHSQSHLDFSSGVNVILGDTDSGKTAILRAINWVVTNRPRGNSFIRKGKKSCSVGIQTNSGVVERQKKPSFNGYKIKSTESQGSFTEVGTSVPPEIIPVLCLGDINTQSQLSSHFLVGLSAGNISKSLSELLGFEFADGLASLVKSGGAQVSKDVSRLSEETMALDFKLNILKKKLDAKNKVEESKILFNKLRLILVDASTLEMLLNTHKVAKSKLEKAQSILSKAAPVDLILDKFDTLSSSSDELDNYGALFNKAKNYNFYLSSNKIKLSNFIAVDKVPEKINELSFFIYKFSELLKSVKALKVYSDSLSKTSQLSTQADYDFNSGLKVLEDLVDSLDYCKECLREFTDSDRAAAKSLGQ